MRRAIPITLTEAERGTLTTYARSRTAPARLVQRARMVLAARAHAGAARTLAPPHAPS